jgi:flagellum-specific ATP synthase
MDEPVSDTVRGILDGHIMLERNLARRFHYPAIDVLASISRLATTVAKNKNKKAVGIIRRLMADYADAEDLINVGAYKLGTNPRIDKAIEKREDLENFLVQSVEDKSPINETLKTLGEIAGVEIPPSEMETYVSKMSLLPVEEYSYDESFYIQA